ncbi:MAG: hypothetical protein JRF34_09405 [Deltaproteobacteria bacterium]|nr:hypothetical protein [Deltaproteobacteria bacterium]
MAFPFRPMNNISRLLFEVTQASFSSKETDCADKDIISPSDNFRLETDCFFPEGNSALINQEVANTPV